VRSWPLLRLAVLTGALIWISTNQGMAQIRDDGATDKRSYGDPLPGGDGSSPTERTMTLVEAAESGGLAEARSAFLVGESVNSRTRRGAPAILIAAQANNLSVLRFLLEKQANPDLFDRSTGRTALIAAAQAGQDNMVRMLLEHKADPDRQDRQGETALMKAARVGAADVVQTLLASGLDVNLTDYAGNTALWHARAARNARIIKMIENAGGI
jgi:uncharacterized protein